MVGRPENEVGFELILSDFELNGPNIELRFSDI